MTSLEVCWRRPRLYPKQLAAIFDPARYSVIEASTKAGKTVGCLVWLTEQAWRTGRRGRNYWWVAPTYGQARDAFDRLKRFLPQDTYKANEAELRITLLNGAVLWFRSGEKPDNLYGPDVYAVVIDEATRCREEAWHAVRTTLTATKGPIRIISNVKGRKNWAYRMARKAEAGEPDMVHHRLIAADAVAAGILAAEEVDDARRRLPAAVFRELFEAEASDDEGNPFGMDAIRACIGPLSERDPEAWGWDLAKSVDWTVGVGLDADGHTAGFKRFQAPWKETIERVRRETGTARAVVDSTGVGDPVVEALQRGGDGGGQFEGFKFSAPSKQQLMEGLAVAIQRGEIIYPEGPIVSELEGFEYQYSRTGVRYSAPEGSHDDCVMALGLAVHARGHRAAEPRIRAL